MTDNNRAKLFQKILEVQRALEPIEKSGRNEFYRYSYTTSSDVLLPVQRACNEHGLVIIADVIDTKIYPERAAAEVLVRLTVVDSETGESHSITASGYAEDWSYKDNRATGDKAVYKATTGAVKYSVRVFFCLPSEDDPERVTPTPTATPTSSNGKAPKTTVNTSQLSIPATSTNGKHPKPVTGNAAPVPRPQPASSSEPPAMLAAVTPAANEDAIARLIDQTTLEMRRLAWGINEGRAYLQQAFNKKSRKELTTTELLKFLNHLRSQPSDWELASPV